MTLTEIRFGIEYQANSVLRGEFEIWLAHQLRPWFAERILPLDEEAILEWRRMVERGRARKIVFSQPDLFIVATAQVHVLTVCTRNERDFRGTDVQVFNPWSE